MSKQRATDFRKIHAPNERWLEDAIPEEAIDPSLAIVDTHMHLWHSEDRPKYLVEQFLEDIWHGGHTIEASIYAECGSFYENGGPEHLRSVGETKFAVEMGDLAGNNAYTNTRVAAGIVGFADLRLGNRVDEVLDAHLEAGRGRFRGIRQIAKWHSDPRVNGSVGAHQPYLYLDPDVQSGLARVAKRELVFEASVYHTQIPDVIALAKAVPSAQIILIHTGSPLGRGSYAQQREQVHSEWLRSMRELADYSNVSVMVGGMLMSLANFDFVTADRPPTSVELTKLWRPFIEPCFELFGPDRCMLGSNFPVEKAGINYRTIWNTYKRIIQEYSLAEKQAILSGTAKRIFRL